MTPVMQANDLMQAFNSCTERSHWKAFVGGTRQLPTVIFKSATAMVELTYYVNTQTFAVVFNKATCAWGDFMLSAHRSVLTVLTAMKATGYHVGAPMELDDGVVRIQYDPTTKQTFVSIANTSDDWTDHKNTGPVGYPFTEVGVRIGIDDPGPYAEVRAVGYGEPDPETGFARVENISGGLADLIENST